MQPELYFELAPDDQARTVAAELLDRLTLNSDGQPLADNDPSQWTDADEAEPAVVTLGAVRFKVVSVDAEDLAVAVGAIEPGDLNPCWLVQFAADEGAPQPSMGQYLHVATEEPGVSVLFLVWITHTDIIDPVAPDFGPDAVRNEALNAIGQGQALIVQVFDEAEVAL